MRRIIRIGIFIAFCGYMIHCGTKKPGQPPEGYASFTTLKLAYLLGFLDRVETEPEIPTRITEFKDLVYKQIGDRSLKLDIYYPDDLTTPVPLLVFIHGGGWKKGDKSDYLRYLVDFAQKGYVTATISYRFSKEAVFPAAVEDVKCAIRWLKKHAEEYHIDPNKIAVIGGSAGGHLAMMIGYSSDDPVFNQDCESDSVSSNVQAVVNLYGPSDMTTDFAIIQKSLLQFIGEPFDVAPQKYIKASPITYITADDPPTLIFHGTLDETVPIKQSDILVEKLKEKGVIFDYHRLDGWPHTMDLAVDVNEYCQYHMINFFEKYLASKTE
jgi:acetyl esterase/lipase